MTVDDEGIIDLLRARAERDPCGVFARFDDVPITFAMLARQAASLAAALRARGLAAAAVSRS